VRDEARKTGLACLSDGGLQQEISTRVLTAINDDHVEGRREEERRERAGGSEQLTCERERKEEMIARRIGKVVDWIWGQA